MSRFFKYTGLFTLLAAALLACTATADLPPGAPGDVAPLRSRGAGEVGAPPLALRQASTPTPLAITVLAPPFNTATPTPLITATPPIKPTWTATPWVEPAGCEQPPDDYTRVTLGYATLNARTLAMLDHAEALYHLQSGVIEDFRLAIAQGSYNAGGVAASFGTHDAGGAVDLSVRSRIDWSVLYDQIPLLIEALRVAGFAAWLRDQDELYAGSPIHIHAIAIGDAEASEAARAQIDGTFGYLRGFDGLPRPDGIPYADRHGGPILCQWMLDLGYQDLRGQPYPTATPSTPNPNFIYPGAS